MKKIKINEKALIGKENQLILSTQLSRIINVIQANNRQYLRIIRNGNSLTIRDQIELILYHAAIIFEGIEAIKKEKSILFKLKCCLNNPELVKNIKNEIKPTSFTQTCLKKIRNKLLFHYDRDIIDESTITSIIQKEEYFAESESGCDSELVFILADNILLSYIFTLINGNYLGSLM